MHYLCRCRYAIKGSPHGKLLLEDIYFALGTRSSLTVYGHQLIDPTLHRGSVGLTVAARRDIRSRQHEICSFPYFRTAPSGWKVRICTLPTTTNINLLFLV